jgi:LuxR family maltose regulon positive regulatory protein
MAGTLLESKLRVPRRRPDLSVARPRLSERLGRGSESALTLLSAPAGFGKTTLLTEWLRATAEDGRSTAWLSLDERDNDPALFWRYLLAALDSVAPDVGARALALLQTPQVPLETVLATLLNDLAAIPSDVVLVLDDYHVIDTPEVHAGMAFLLEHLPQQVHLVLASRADPALPLARLRARGELVEIRAVDLRFTPDEAGAYLNEVMGLALTAADVTALEGRTEGWIAALQLAALSIQGRDDIAAFIAGFAGDDRYIIDYLADEVLHRQPVDVQHFLLRTSILDRLNGPLCDAITGQANGKSQLAALERGNLFLVPLDDRRQWYRYHKLFADVLQAHLLDEHPDDVPDLHRRASAWYEQNSEPSEAIRHALAAADFERAASLVELAIPVMSKVRQEATLRRWLLALPDDVFRARPVLCIGFAGAMLVSGDLDGVEDRLSEAEYWLHPTTAVPKGPHLPPAEMVVEDDEVFRRLPGLIEVYRSAIAQARGDLVGAVTHARRALDLAPGDDHLGRAAAAGFLALAAWTAGDLEGAHRAWVDCMNGLEHAGHIADAIGCAIALADIRLEQGRLSEAMRTYEHALQRAPAQSGTVLRGTADMHVGMSGVHRERNDLRAATQDLLTSQELGEQNGLAQNPYRSRVAMARIRAAEGDLNAALGLLVDAERVYTSDYYPQVHPIPAMQARLRVVQGELGEALSWAREQGLSSADDLSYLREFDHITLARLLLAQYAAERNESSVDKATRLLERLLHAAEGGGRTASVIEILVLQALARQARAEIPAALAALEQALMLAEPEGYVRVFVDEGQPMTALLRAIEKKGVARNYVRRILSASSTADDSAPAADGLFEPLSERELDVLRLLASDLDGPAIARELFVSLNTMRTHTKSIYAKLGVNSRRAAVGRARELGLV